MPDDDNPVPFRHQSQQDWEPRGFRARTVCTTSQIWLPQHSMLRTYPYRTRKGIPVAAQRDTRSTGNTPPDESFGAEKLRCHPSPPQARTCPSTLRGVRELVPMVRSTQWDQERLLYGSYVTSRLARSQQGTVVEAHRNAHRR